jgi:hypothetical protein
MSETLEENLARLMDIEHAAANYLSHLAAVEQGSQYDQGPLDYWRDELERLTA